MMIQLVKARTNLEPYTKTIKELTYSFYDLVKRKILVMNLYTTNSGPEMLFLLLKALISISAPFSPTRLTS